MSGHINYLCLSNKRALCIQEVRLKGHSSYTSTAASADILDIVDNISHGNQRRGGSGRHSWSYTWMRTEADFLPESTFKIVNQI
jgi:hypothetical protein